MATTRTTSAHDGVFTDEEVEALTRASLFKRDAPIINGKRKVWSTVLDLPDRESQRRLNRGIASGVISVAYRDEGRPARAPFTLNLPVDPISTAALEYIGLTAPAATEIYSKYVVSTSSTWSEDGGDDDVEKKADRLLECACCHVARLETAEYQDMPPAQALEAVGVDENMRNTLLDPYFSDILGTETMSYWVQDTLKMRARSLRGLHGSHGHFRPATPNAKGQYSAAVLEELESQNDNTATSLLSQKVGQLKQLTIAIGDEIRDSTTLAGSVNDQFENAGVRLKGTMRRMLRMAERTGVGWKVWLGFFVALWLLFAWVWLF
ncbi:hypothetical protein DV735_g5079, partial [Chaetothyriales sp. CBS 134920]